MARAPDSVDQDKFGNALTSISSVVSYHDMHLWTFGSKEIVGSVHLLINDKNVSMNVLNSAIAVSKKFGINHCTFQIEIEGEFDPATEHYGTLYKNDSISIIDEGHGHGHKDEWHGHGHGHDDHGHGGHGHEEHGCGGHGH